MPDDPCATAARQPWDGPYDWNAETEEWVCQAHGTADCHQSPTCEHYGRIKAQELAVRRAITHDVKCWPLYYERVLDGSKTFEVRLNDRDYQEGDRIVLNEWDPDTGHYTNRRLRAVIGYVLRDYCAAIPDFAGHVVFSLHRIVVEA